MQKSSLLILQLRQQALNQRLKKVEKAILQDYKSLTTPTSPTNNMEDWLQKGMRVWSIVDGVLMGYKLMKRLGTTSLFRKSMKK